jgi:signal transduction histidine kinase
VLSTTAETVGRALKLPMVEVRLRDGTVVHWGATSGIATAEPLRAQGRDVGQLLLGERRPGESLTARDLELAAQVASQIAVAADSLLLTNDLRASRSRIVEAREDERRRLRRDLHDGLGPSLAGLALQASAISEVAQSDPDTAARLGGAVAAGIRGVIADVRRLVYGLRPPALDELGLLGGLRAAAQGLEVAGRFRIVVDAAEPLPALPASVEAAAYRIASEAMANAARHAEATVCTVRLRTDAVLLIEVEDDGTGIPEGTAAGVGLLGMRERAAEVGGVVEVRAGEQRGTLVRARLPLAVPAEEAA